MKVDSLSAAATYITIPGGSVFADNILAYDEPDTHGTHIHFFFDPLPPEQVNTPGSGPWIIYGSTAPFTGYAAANRPTVTIAKRALVVNHDHSVRLNTGRCYPLR